MRPVFSQTYDEKIGIFWEIESFQFFLSMGSKYLHFLNFTFTNFLNYISVNIKHKASCL